MLLGQRDVPCWDLQRMRPLLLVLMIHRHKHQTLRDSSLDDRYTKCFPLLQSFSLQMWFECFQELIVEWHQSVYQVQQWLVPDSLRCRAWCPVNKEAQWSFPSVSVIANLHSATAVFQWCECFLLRNMLLCLSLQRQQAAVLSDAALLRRLELLLQGVQQEDQRVLCRGPTWGVRGRLQFLTTRVHQPRHWE